MRETGRRVAIMRSEEFIETRDAGEAATKW
jgi:hypothetical protein